MSKRGAILLLAGALAAPLASPVLGSENMSSVVRTASEAKDFASYLPAPPLEVPWLNVDPRTKLPKGDFPLGRNVDSIGRLALPSTAHTLISVHQEASGIVDRRM